MPKYDQLSELIKKRIANGDYAVTGVPVERQLALETGVARMTARRALQQLHDEGILVRSSTGRLEVSRDKNTDSYLLQIAFLSPSFNSHRIDGWRVAMEHAAAQAGGRVRQLQYVHWDDPFFIDGVDGFDGVFLLPSSEPMPSRFIERLIARKRPLVMLQCDLTHIGIPSLRLFPPIFVQSLLNHLEERGHERIACLNVQPHDEVIEERIGQWKVWMAAHHCSGSLYDEPVEPFGDALVRAYEVVQRLLASDGLDATALLCTTYAAALGAMRAMHEKGIRPGRDLAVCAVDGEGQAKYLVPSLTALEAPDAVPYMLTCLRWMAQGGGRWNGPLMLQPSAVPMEIRESTNTYFPRKPGLATEQAVFSNTQGDHNVHHLV